MKKVIPFILGVLLVFNACKKTPNADNVLAYDNYLDGYPSNTISCRENLSFILKQSPDVLEVSEDIISTSPNIKGKVALQGNKIIFTPENQLKNGKKYMVTLHLSKLFNKIDKKLADFTCEVKTKKLDFSVELETPKAYDKNYYYINGSVTSSDYFESEMLSKIVSAKYNGKIKKIKYDNSEKKYSSYVYFNFKIDSLKRFDDDKILNVEWTGSPINSDSKGSEDVTIIGKNNFKVLDVKITDKIRQEVEISFSDPLDKNQNLKGLIQFLDVKDGDFTYKIHKNIVRIYPTHTFKNTAKIQFFKGIKNNSGYKLKDTHIVSVNFEEPKPSISFIKSGAILPKSKNLKINFYATNLRAVDVTIYRVYKNNILQYLQENKLTELSDLRYVGRPETKYTINLSDKGLKLAKPNAFAFNLADMISVKNGEMYRVELSIKKEYSNYTCDGVTPTNTIKYGRKDVNDYDGVNYRDYNWDERNNPCTDSYFYDAKISTNIFATDLGIIVKKGNNNSTFVAVTNLLTAKPVANAKVTLYDFQQQPIISQRTNSNGIARFNTDKNVFFATASQGKNTTYIRLKDGNALSMSNFDVSGAKLESGLQGYIYGERGVWRPGDTMFLTFVLNDKENPLPKKHPIKFELINPQGKIIDRKIQYKNTENVYIYTPKTEQSALTGNWELIISVGSSEFTKRLKVETIKPNRLKINIKIDKEIKANEKISGTADVKWLHGAIARDLKIDIQGKFKSTKTEFKNFGNYNFDDITRYFGTEEFTVFEGNLNNEGQAKFSVNPSFKNKAPGMLKAYFISKAYENGGDFSTDVFSKKVSTYTSYAGLNSAEEKESKNYLYTDKNYIFNVVSVDENGKGFSNDLDVKVYKISWRWWWRKNCSGLSEYDGSTYHEPYVSENIKTNSQGKGHFNLKIDKNDWGRYLVKVQDKKSGHTTANIVYFDWPDWYGLKQGNTNDNASMLVFTTDKESYSINETATIKFPSSAGSRALVTIENGTKVLDHFWVETKDKQTSFEFPVLPEYAPNVFVNISLLQKHSQTKNDLPIRMYGSVPMLVSDPNTKLEPEITMPDELKPETTAKISVKEKHGKPMTYTIALVDEGLLDLTRFKTPNTWDKFYARQSLGVKTWDIFDDVIGAYGGKINQILSIGGDEAKSINKNKKANRFKPMVIHLGKFTISANQSKTHEIKIPKYIGSVRAMVVASNVSKNAYGSAEKTAFVRSPLMILASLPRKITPKETVTLPVTIFAMKPHIKDVKLSLEPNNSYTIIGNKTQQISFKQPDEKMVYFKLKVNDFKGIGKIKINAVSGSEKTSYDVEIDVENPNPLTTETLDLVLKSNEEGSFDFSSFGTKGTNITTLELSSLPPMNFTSRLDYLIQYPHGCVEQTTSSAFPQLYFTELFDLSNEKKQKIERNIKATIRRLSKFQLANGGLSYWQGNSSADDWGTSYAGHFMIEANKKGYILPFGFKEKWISFQKKQAREWNKNSYNGLEQAYRLYTLCLANQPDLSSMNRMIETTGLDNSTKLRLASAYALIGKKSIAKKILETLSSNDKKHYYYYGSELRDKAMSLETYTFINDDVKAIKLAKTIAKKLSSNDWLSTQTTAYTLIAMSEYATKNGGKKGINASYIFNGNNANANTSKALFTTDLKPIEKNNKFKITNNNNGVLYVRLFNKGILPVGEEKVLSKNLSADVSFYTKNGDKIEPTKIKQGTNFVAKVIIKNTSDKNIDNVALTQYFPSGWEIVNTRFTDAGSNTSLPEVDYTDIRDASISNYFSLKANQSKIFKVLLNTSYLGSYYLSGIQAQAMYDNDYIVRTKGQWVEVVK